MDPASKYDHHAEEVFSSLKLTPREGEVLFWISQGKSNRDIGIILGAKTGTICKHVEHIFGKLSVENRTSAAMVALQACRSSASQSESGARRSWPAVAGVLATQLAEFWSGVCEFYDALAASCA